MKLTRLAESIGAKASSCPDIEIRELFMDSRLTVSDGLFFCISGSTFYLIFTNTFYSSIA